MVYDGKSQKKTWMIEQSHFRLFESDMTNLKLDLVFVQTSSDIHTFSCPFPDILRYKLIALASGDQLSGISRRKPPSLGSKPPLAIPELQNVPAAPVPSGWTGWTRQVLPSCAPQFFSMGQQLVKKHLQSFPVPMFTHFDQII